MMFFGLSSPKQNFCTWIVALKNKPTNVLKFSQPFVIGLSMRGQLLPATPVIGPVTQVLSLASCLGKMNDGP